MEGVTGAHMWDLMVRSGHVAAVSAACTGKSDVVVPAVFARAHGRNVESRCEIPIILCPNSRRRVETLSVSHLSFGAMATIAMVIMVMMEKKKTFLGTMP
jgi:hypothetical protein